MIDRIINLRFNHNMTLSQVDIDEIEKLIDEKIKLLPSRDEFLSWMDKLMKELQTTREEITILGHQVSDHEDRIMKLENFSPIPAS